MSDRGWGAWCPGWVGASHGICQRPTLQCTRWCTRWWQVDDSSTANTSVFCFQLVKPQTQVNFSHLWLTKDIFFFDIFGSRNQFWSCSSVNLVAQSTQCLDWNISGKNFLLRWLTKWGENATFLSWCLAFGEPFFPPWCWGANLELPEDAVFGIWAACAGQAINNLPEWELSRACTLCTVKCTLCTVHSAQCIIHCPMCTVHCELYTVCTVHRRACVPLLLQQMAALQLWLLWSLLSTAVRTGRLGPRAIAEWARP